MHRQSVVEDSASEASKNYLHEADIDEMEAEREHLETLILQSGARKTNLLDLPVEILTEIVKEVGRINGLASLALTCSVLHAVAIPVLYSEFNVVWPDLGHSPYHSGRLEALSQGLATLTMSEDLFDSCDERDRNGPKEFGVPEPAVELKKKLRRANNYAKYTRKIEIANSPTEQFQPYYLHLEVGKTFNNLVALAVSKAVNLETFIWDMPTGVSGAVWRALSSVANRPGHNCRLERVWLRCDPPDTELAMPAEESFAWELSQRHTLVEYPTLSILPPVKSLTVLKISEPSCAEEIAVLIERSRDRLKELRLSMDPMNRAWSMPPADATWASLKWPKIGGFLEVLTGPFEVTMFPPSKLGAEGSERRHPDTDKNHYVFLELEVLELEDVVMSVPVLMQTIDWTKLTTLTILDCGGHESLWRNIRSRYASSSMGPSAPSDFPLRLKHIHTSRTSPWLMLFLRDTIAPNTLETVFLHEVVWPHQSRISRDMIYRIVFQRHHSSLKRLLINVADNYHIADEALYHWRRLRFDRKMLSFITGGKMSQLQELSMGIDAQDRSYFIQGLSNLPNLRALHIINTCEELVSRSDVLAHQLKDIVGLMPHLSLTYIAITDKCYEIVDTRYDDSLDTTDAAAAEDEELDFSNSDTELMPDEDFRPNNPHYLSSDMRSQPDPCEWGLEDDEDLFEGGRPPWERFRLREILFPDYEVGIFKARHGAL